MWNSPKTAEDITTAVRTFPEIVRILEYINPLNITSSKNATAKILITKSAAYCQKYKYSGV